MSRLAAARLVFVAALVAILAYDLLAVIVGWETVSRGLSTLAAENPVVTFLAGFVCGHFFWPVYQSSKRR